MSATEEKRPLCIAGNWKMGHTPKSAAAYVFSFKKILDSFEFKRFCGKTMLDVVLFPPYIHLMTMSGLFSDYPVHVGAQNMHSEEKGAYTGEISSSMLKGAGCSYVIIGHSERRKYFLEKEDFLAQKIYRAFKENLRPVYCVGESEEERLGNNAKNVVKKQLVDALGPAFAAAKKDGKTLDSLKLVLAYEPVWAIGTGKNATSGDAEEMARYIRETLASLTTQAFAEKTQILYGGSAKPENVAAFLREKNVDGVLVGGASLKADSFAEMVHIAMELSGKR